MKRLLSFLTITMLAATSVSAVASCSSTTSNPAQDIINKIVNTKINVVSTTNPSTIYPATVTAIKMTLRGANPTLSSSDLTKLTFSHVTLQKGVATPVTVTATDPVSKTTASKSIHVTLSSNSAQDIIDKIMNTKINVVSTTNPNTTNSATVTAIKMTLRGANPTLSSSDLTKLTFSHVTLQKGVAIAVMVTATTTSTANKTITVILSSNKAQDVVDKITDTKIFVPTGTNPNTSNTKTVKVLQDQVKSANSTITDQEKLDLSFSQATLKIGKQVSVSVFATVEGVKATGPKLNITIRRTPSTKNLLSGYWYLWKLLM